MKPRLLIHRLRTILTIILSISVVAAFVYLIHDNRFDVLQPAGWVAGEQRNLLIFASLLSLIIVVPVFALTFYIVWNYRTTHSHPPKFDASFTSSPRAEFIWWSVPIVLIAVLGVVIWQSSHQLDPYKALASDKQPLNVQVVALDWKWLFIYPDQGIASVNQLQIPVGRPVNFRLTSDAPMTSFWIPKLGGQVYAMSGMETKLHLIADESGQFTGRNANISGEGYSGMAFNVNAVSEQEFGQWVAGAKAAQPLTVAGYDKLAQPTKNIPAVQYDLQADGLFDRVIMKYMSAHSTMEHDDATSHDATEHAHDE